MQLTTLPIYAVCKDKQYYETAWQRGKSYDYCQQQIRLGNANGYGIITGNGLVALDFDGHGATTVANRIGQWLTADDTMAWTSGKEGHHQRLYRIPPQHITFWQDITKHDLPHDNDHLEIRYNNHASVLPPSVHPETGHYRWLREVEPRVLTIPQSYDLLNQCTVYQPADITADSELRMIEEALAFIPADDYDTWWTVGAGLYRHGIDITVWEAWSQSSANYDGKGIDKKWQSFSNISNITIGTVLHLAKQHGFDQRAWMRQHLKGQRKALNHSLTQESTADNTVVSLTQQLVERLAQPDVTDHQRDIEIAIFCHQHRTSERAIRQAIASYQLYLNQQIDIAELHTQFDDLLGVPDLQLPLEQILGAYPATVVREIASVVPTNADALFTIMLPTIASMIGTQSTIIVNEHIGYELPFILRTMIVAPSGKKKSPTARLAIDCLHRKNNKAYTQYQRDLEVWQQQEGKGQEPKQRFYLIQDATIDGMIAVHADNPKGFLCYVDEVYGYFNRMNKFTKGGDDVQRDLELYEGKPLIKVRKNKDSNVFLPRTAISITGTIQEVAIQKILGNADDLTGISARWLLWAGKMPNGYLMDRTAVDSSYYDMMSMLADSLEWHDYSPLTIADDAYLLLQQWQRNIVDTIPKLHSMQCEAKYSKIEADTIKIAGILHYFHLFMGDVDCDTVIDKATMERAIVCANYYLAHYNYMVEKSNGGLLSSQLLRLMEIVQKKGIATANDVFKASRQWKHDGLTVQDIGHLMLQLVELGKLERIATNKGVKVKYRV